ncbi:MAG: exodeoxyribonuclease VII large subunit, partial [Chitinophagaceae bacterium]|nr:exodeoxyribonuclease VII large subunit [Chitinophagaceae bacterium]
MSHVFSLSQLLALVQDTIDAQYFGQAFWVKCEVTDVKKYDAKNWCFCKFLEKRSGQVLAETQGVFWQQGYQHIRRFEQVTGRKFENGIEINALVLVKFHPKFGFKLEVIEIDLSFSLGQMELARQETIQKLLALYPDDITLVDDRFFTPNNRIPLPHIIQRVALITANHSDGQRDFLQELTQNTLGYQFRITGFYTTIQGESAAGLMIKQFEQVKTKSHLFDVVVLVRGGGSQTDLKPFDDFELAKTIAMFPVPVLTGIGHDRNTSIADLMARQYKVPTKVAATIIDHNFRAEQSLLELETRMIESVESTLLHKKQQLNRWEEQMAWVIPGRISLKLERLSHWKTMIELKSKTRIDALKRAMQMTNERLDLAQGRRIKEKWESLQSMERMIDHLSPQRTLAR